jgi:hypothetical protein
MKGWVNYVAKLISKDSYFLLFRLFETGSQAAGCIPCAIMSDAEPERLLLKSTMRATRDTEERKLNLIYV